MKICSFAQVDMFVFAVETLKENGGMFVLAVLFSPDKFRFLN